MAVEIPQLNSCCCGCTLKTGTKIIGWLELIGGILLVIAMWIGIVALTHIQEHPDTIPPDVTNRDEFLKLIPVMKILLYILLGMSLIGSVLSFVLLLGVYQNKPSLVMVWIVATLTITILTAIINVAQLIAFAHNNLASNVASLLLNIYYLLVVYSYYREINNVSNNYA